MNNVLNGRRYERPDLRTALESAGFLVFDASDGGRELERLREFWAALILDDLPLPRMSGLEILRCLRGAGDGDPEGIVVMQGRVPDAIAAMRLGSVDVLARPLNSDALGGVVEGLIHRAGGPLSRSAGCRVLVAVDPLAFDLLRAKRALDRREFGEAERLLRAIIVLDPDSAVAHTLIALLHERLGEYRAAFRSCLAALRADRHYVPALENLRRCCKRFGLNFHDTLFDVVDNHGKPPSQFRRSSA